MNTNRQEKELFHTLCTNIEFTGVENRVIVFTSCEPNAGKTMVAYQTARTFAEMGKRTILLDADLRKSVLLRRLRINDRLKGLSHVLSGQAPVGEAIYATNVENLYLLPTGIFPVNPAELLGNERFKKLIEALRNTFDCVIVDTPPVGRVIDAAVVAKQCDGTIFVLSAGESNRKEVKSSIEQMQLANKNVLGVVLNKYETTDKSYYAQYGDYKAENVVRGKRKR